MSAAALDLVRYGFTVFPLQPKSKEPLRGLRWKEAASREESVAARYSDDCNVAVVMGRESGFVGLDIDYDDGADPEYLKQLPPSWTVKTGKGHHVYYRYPKHWPEIGKGTLLKAKSNGSGRPKPCVQLRANGHYFVAPGSIHPETGARYEWAKHEGMYDGLSCDFLSPGEIECAEAPDSILDAIAAESHVEKPTGEKYPANERHIMFIGTATAMRIVGSSEEEIYQRLVDRNANDCAPPKEAAESELRRISRWAFKTVIVDEAKARQEGLRKKQALASESLDKNLSVVRALGHLDNDYYYQTSSNRQILSLNYSSHNESGLTHLMPKRFWMENFPGKREEPDFSKAADFLKERCRIVGIYSEERLREPGAWLDDDRLCFHLGDGVFVDGSSVNLSSFKSRHVYVLSKYLPEPGKQAATLDECGILLKAAMAPKWERPGSPILLAGALAIARLSGALPWRPHVWITGAAGSGKTTLMTTLVSNMIGGWGCYVQGSTTEAGVRQKLGARSLPVVFDEAESSDRAGAGRMQRVLELARQASSQSEAYIVKGTVSGKGMQYKCNSMFIMSSIRVNLVQEADQTRFAVLELARPTIDPDVDDGFKSALEAVSSELGEKVFRRMIDRWPQLLSNYRSLSAMIAAKSTHRHGQQYGMLLAGYGCLVSDLALDVSECSYLVEQAGVIEAKYDSSIVQDELDCLYHLVSCRIRMQHVEDGPMIEASVAQLLLKADTDSAFDTRLQSFGLRVIKHRVAIANSHPELAKIFKDTKWAGNWNGSIGRMDKSQKGNARMEGRPSQRVVFVPMDCVISDEPDPDRVNAPF